MLLALLMSRLLLPAAHAGGSWSDDFADDDISDWTLVDGAWSVSGGVITGYSSSHYGPDLVIDPGMDEGVTSYTITYEIAGSTSFGIIPDYGANSSEYCQMFWWAGSTLYRSSASVGEQSVASHTWSYSTWYTVEALVTPGNVAVYEDGTLIYSGDLLCESFTTSGMVGIGLHQSATMYLDSITVEWDYLDNDGDGYTEDTGDCDDDDSAIHPSAAEVCDGIDNDCDDAVDDDDASLDAGMFYADADSDGYGDPTTTEIACDVPAGFVEDDTDCDDGDGDVNPMAAEVCNGIDDDCDGDVDDSDDSVDASTFADWYADADADGYGDAATAALACDAPEGFLGNDTDCDDTNGAVNPAADEICDGLDDDCDGDVDDDDADVDLTTASTWYFDGDGDDYGDTTMATLSCDAAPGYVAANADCDDTDAAFHPGADESDCTDPSDYNCDGSVAYDDEDADGSPACVDCDDTNPAVAPWAVEVCNGIDDDCDGLTDDADSDVDPATGSPWYYDADGDDFGDATMATISCDAAPGYVADDTDCDDLDAAFHPGADEFDCTDPNDYNCDGSVAYEDQDADGSPACLDCDDTDGDVNPGATEVCNGLDDDCDGDVDDADGDVDPTSYTAWYADRDEDGYGDSATSTLSCDAPAGYTTDDSDCDDADGDVNPGATEVCNGLDDDCDGDVDDEDADLDLSSGSTWYYDGDGDGYGDTTMGTMSCDAATGYVADGADCDDADADFHPSASESDCMDPNDYNCDGSVGYADQDGDGSPACVDCDDANADVVPGALEVCNSIDDDCNGDVDDDDAGVDSSTASLWYDDQDADGYGDPSTATLSCDAPYGFIADATDCDDTDAGYHPGASESDCTDPNDYNCDGLVAYEDQDADGSPACSDCDDTNSAVAPGALEVCNDIDDDCDALVDDADADVDLTTGATWYDDADGDNYGDPATGTISCDASAGFIADATDCDDADAAYHPGAEESDCTDPNDYNCDGSVGYADQDADGSPACLDCDDSASAVNPSASEVCNGIDDDCDELVDDDDDGVDLSTGSSWYADQDADGYGDPATGSISCDAASGSVADDTDCNDADAAYHPGAAESDCTDPNDYNCDGSVGYDDQDADGSPACMDCDDAASAVNPAASEVCNDIDDDCDALVDDEDDSLDLGTASTWYADADGDGYGDPAAPSITCEQGEGTVTDATDCDDADATIYPGAPGWNDDCTPVDTDTDTGTPHEDTAAIDGDTVKGGGGCGCATPGGTSYGWLGMLAAVGWLVRGRRR